jgi:general secretion pathway protein L
MTLPPAEDAASAADGAPWRAHWWRIADGRICARGQDGGWPELDARTQIIGIAPAADCTLHHAAFPGLTEKQAASAAHLFAAGQTIEPAAQLHSAITAADSGGQRIIATCAAARMADWTGWAIAQGLALAAIIPAGLLVPVDDSAGAAPDALTRARVGGEAIIRGRAIAFADDPALTPLLAPDAAMIGACSEAALDAAMVSACDAPPANLLSGRFAPAGAAWFDGVVLRRAAMLAGLIVLMSLGIAIASLWRLNADTARLDALTQEQAARALSAKPTAERAIGDLDAKLAMMGGGPARITNPLAGLLQAMDPVPAVAIDTLNWRNDGTLTVTLGAARVEDINAVLLTLQAARYSVTAVPRGNADGRSLADITIRSAP